MTRSVLVILFVFLSGVGNAQDIFNKSNDAGPKRAPKTFAECLDRLDIVLPDSLKDVVRQEDEKEFCARFFRCSEFEDGSYCQDNDFGLKKMLNLVNTGYPDSIFQKNVGTKKAFSNNEESGNSDISAWFNLKGVHNSDVMLRILFYAYHRILNNMDSAETDPERVMLEYTNVLRLGKNRLIGNSASEQAHSLALMEKDVFNAYRFSLLQPGDTVQEIILMHEGGKPGFVSIYFKVLKKTNISNTIKAEVVTIQYENPDGQIHFYDKGTYKFTAYKMGKVFDYRADELVKNEDEDAYKAWLKGKEQ